MALTELGPRTGCAAAGEGILASYFSQAMKTLSALCVTNLETSRVSEGMQETTVFWKDIPTNVVDGVVARGLVMSSASTTDLVGRWRILARVALDVFGHGSIFRASVVTTEEYQGPADRYEGFRPTCAHILPTYSVVQLAFGRYSCIVQVRIVVAELDI